MRREQAYSLAGEQRGRGNWRAQQGRQGPAFLFPGVGVASQNGGQQGPGGQDRSGHHVDHLGVVEQAQLGVAYQKQAESREQAAEGQQPQQTPLTAQHLRAFFAGDGPMRFHSAPSCL